MELQTAMETKQSLTRNSQKENPEEKSESKMQRRICVANLKGVDFVWEKGPMVLKDVDIEWTRD